ncbi:serine/arginine repetitive matrix protein 1-like, partial [Sceloporus undulatus]|uniref:serine/arginine repetitive matrix protein 1-like n=1 Tax=Sceloporus undulatus TaxID=8520 RepID=UPI001C4B720D
DGPSSAPPSTSDRSGGPNPEANVARGSDKPSATTKPTKHPHKSGSVGTAAASTSSRKRDAPAKTSRPASEQTSRKEAPSDPKDGSGTGKDTSSRAKAAPHREDTPRSGGRLTESPIPFFPPDAPRGSASSKKRKASASAQDATASKKSKHSKDRPRKEPGVTKEPEPSTRPRIRMDSPRQDTLSVVSDRPPLREAQQDLSTPGPSAAATVPFLLSNEEDFQDRLSRSPSRELPSRSPSPARRDRDPRSPSPAPLSPLPVPDDDGVFYDSEADQFYLKVSRRVAMSRMPSRDHPRDRPREGSQLNKRQRDPVPASRAALLQPAPRPADKRNVVVQVESSDSEADASVATEDPSDVEDPPRQSPQDLHYPEAASPSDDVRSFAEHIIKMSRALDIDLVYPEADAEDQVERRVHGRVPTPPCVPFLPSLQTILKRSWDSPSSLLGPPRKIESLYRVAAPNAPWLMSHPRQNSAIVEGAQQTSTQRQTTSPVDKEAKKIDSLAKKA